MTARRKIQLCLSGMGIVLIVVMILAGAAFYYLNHKSNIYEQEITQFMGSFLKSFEHVDSSFGSSRDTKNALISLGQFEGCPKRDDNKASFVFGNTPRATVEFHCNFTESNAVIGATLEKVDGSWYAKSVTVKSPLFVLDIPNTNDK
ncbi:hypothetical protein [Amphritea pacifica]|uniref:hypothetical protein n=1 Tax=Amphritea pacifica TaxID=2811233 RepID=UPI00196266ED|nr:hypothetical protein [Amphritea pacifica]MBN1009187.1 hypothetical protein [Amphritea pacifica]